MPFKELFDLPLLQSQYRVVLLSDKRKDDDWGRQLDAVAILAIPQKEAVRSLAADLLLRAPDPSLWFISPVSYYAGCEPQQLANLRSMLQPYRTVGVQTFHGLVHGSQWLSGPPDCHGSACCEAFKATFPYLRKAPRIYQYARAFIHRDIGGTYVAAHVRPYPDPCIVIWTNNTYATEEERYEAMHAPDEPCFNPWLYKRFAPAIKHLADKYATQRVFVMAPPSVRGVVRAKLEAEAGIRPVFMELEHLAHLTKGVRNSDVFADLSFSLLAMVEEAVAGEAVAFVGTKESSMTGTIIQERLGQGMAPEHCYSFSGHANYSDRPATLSEYFAVHPVSRTKHFKTPMPPLPPPRGKNRKQQRVDGGGTDTS